MSGLTTERSRYGGSRVGQKHAWEKIVLNFYFSWTVNSNKYAALTTLSSTLLRTKKENCQKIRNLGEVFQNRLRVLSRRGLGWPANWPVCQPPWWLQNTVCMDRSSLFRVQWYQQTVFWSHHGGWHVSQFAGSELNFHIWNANSQSFTPTKSEPKMAAHGGQFWTSVSVLFAVLYASSSPLHVFNFQFLFGSTSKPFTTMEKVHRRNITGPVLYIRVFKRIRHCRVA